MFSFNFTEGIMCVYMRGSGEISFEYSPATFFFSLLNMCYKLCFLKEVGRNVAKESREIKNHFNKML